MNIQKNMSLMEKLAILTDAAKYDVACTSSGVDRKGNGTGMGNSISCGICHTFSADGRCISLLKILYTNECVFDCKYCVNLLSGYDEIHFFLKFAVLLFENIVLETIASTPLIDIII